MKVQNIKFNVSKSVYALPVEELVKRLQSVQKVYPGSVIALDEMNGSLDVYKVLNNGRDAEYLTQVLVS